MTDTKQPFVIYVVEDSDDSDKLLAAFTSRSDANDYAHRFDAFTREVVVDKFDMSEWPEGKRGYGIHARYSAHGRHDVVVFALDGPPNKGRDEWHVDELDLFAWHVQTWSCDREDAKRLGVEYLETKREYVELILKQIESTEKYMTDKEDTEVLEAAIIDSEHALRAAINACARVEQLAWCVVLSDHASAGDRQAANQCIGRAQTNGSVLRALTRL